MVCSPDIREVVLEHARVTALDEHPENDVKPVARGAWRPVLIYAGGEGRGGGGKGTVILAHRHSRGREIIRHR